MRKDEELNALASVAFQKVCKATGKTNYCLCVPQIPEAYEPGEDVLVLGRCLNGGLKGKTIRDLAAEGNIFAVAVRSLLTPIYGEDDWADHVIYANAALVSTAAGGDKFSERLNKTMWNAQYKEIEETYRLLMTRYRPRVTCLMTGNSKCDSIIDRIDFNQPLFEGYHNNTDYEELERHIWGHRDDRDDGTPFTNTLFHNKSDDSYFLELEIPGGVKTEEYVDSILSILRRHNVVK